MDQGQIISKIGKLLKTVTSDGLENEPGTENLVKLILESLATLFYETAESVLMYLVASKKRKKMYLITSEIGTSYMIIRIH